MKTQVTDLKKLLQTLYLIKDFHPKYSKKLM